MTPRWRHPDDGLDFLLSRRRRRRRLRRRHRRLRAESLAGARTSSARICFGLSLGIVFGNFIVV